ncbi:hypothetical protein CRM22_008895 [Opisthorchis felineus]|uniref:Protein kinase domain-containing protein n=1 Tax=Opisthorchis felineus TaxID=147828 RepID=A0A4S2L9Q9_OPIFE|nr:hypothetical protein CRM22_008895 [Opisthorchis felineus]
MTSELEPHILKKFEIKKRLGKGAYGIVWKALNRKTHEIVALKKIFDAFRNQTDAQRTFREIAYLQEFGNHPNIIKLFSVIRANTDKDIYLVFEYMETDLHNVIKRGNLLKDVHRQFIMYQLLKATAYLHSAEVIHRDQKPSNVLLDSDCFVKLCDFGLARSLTGRDGKANGSQSSIPAVPALTEYVATRWYRAPEILLACHNYTKGVDMWSLGCILGEMLSGSPLFPGKSTLDQLERIVAGLPKITREDLSSFKSPYGLSILQNASMKPRQPLEQLFSNADKNALDLMFRMLRLNPHRRITALEALQHPYLRRFYRPSEILTMSHHVVPPLDDNVQLSIAEYRNLLYKMIISNKLRVRHPNRNTQVSNATHTAKVDGEEHSSGVTRSPKEKDQKSSPLKTIPNNRTSQQETVLVTMKSSEVENTADFLKSTEPEMSGDMDKCTSRTLRGSTNGLDGNDENQTTSTDIDTTPRTRTESIKRSQLETKHDLPGAVQKPEVKPCTHSSAVARHSDVATRRRGIQVKPSFQSSYSAIQNKLVTGQCGPAASNNSVGERDVDHHRRLSGTYQGHESCGDTHSHYSGPSVRNPDQTSQQNSAIPSRTQSQWTKPNALNELVSSPSRSTAYLELGRTQYSTNMKPRQEHRSFTQIHSEKYRLPSVTSDGGTQSTTSGYRQILPTTGTTTTLHHRNRRWNNDESNIRRDNDTFLRRCPSASISSNPNKKTQESLPPRPSSPLPDRIYAGHRPKSSTYFERVSYDFRPHSINPRIHGTQARSRLDNHSVPLANNKRLISQEMVLGGHVPTNTKPPPALQHQNGVSGSKISGSLIGSRSFVGGDTLVHERLYKPPRLENSYVQSSLSM